MPAKRSISKGKRALTHSVTYLLAYINSAIMAAIGLLHLYWAVGGQWGLAESVPTDEKGNRVLRTGIVACLVVGLGLLGFSGYYFLKASGNSISLPIGLDRWGIWVLAFVFTARAIGDFRYIGFFKTTKDTAFGQLDTRWYAPLCLYLGLSSAWIGLA